VEVPQPSDYSALDRPEVLQFVFYPRRDWSEPPPGASDHSVPVGDGLHICCRLYPVDQAAPTILYFHGNGEVLSDHDTIAPLYNQVNINLFVADYRGYGSSDGSPTFTALLSDAHAIFHYLVGLLASTGYKGPLFVMGRSLGSYSAVELASHYPERLKGVIIESGFANVVRLLSYLGFPVNRSELKAVEEAHLAKVSSITLPLLVIHGERDMLVPPSEGTSLLEKVGSRDKRLLLIPGAGHNDLMLVGLRDYFATIRDFVAG
jgi:hypothetical protein